MIDNASLSVSMTPRKFNPFIVKSFLFLPPERSQVINVPCRECLFKLPFSVFSLHSSVFQLIEP